MLKVVLSGAVICTLVGCSSADDVGEAVGQEESETTPVETAQETVDRRTAGGSGAVDFTDNAKNGEAEREFNYAWPSEVSAIPELANIIEQQRDKALAEQKTEWLASLKEFAGEGCLTCVNRGYDTSWKVVADTPRFLSLSADSYVYTGGAHGNSYFDALVWDREAEASLSPGALFASPAALWSAVREDYCSGLATERTERRGGVYAEQGGIFDNCPGLDELTLLVGSSNGQTFDRLGLLAAPYVAGAYAEGPYEVNMPVTQAVLAAVKPDYAAAFTAAQ